MKSKLAELESFLKELQENKALFTELFGRGCEILELSDEDAARIFDTSRTNVSRWRQGKVVPPAAALVLKFLRKEVDKKIETIIKGT